MSEPAVLYELDNEPAAVDLTIAAVAMACRMSYSSVNRAVVDYMHGERPPTGTLAHTAVIAWLGAVQYARLVGEADTSHSTRGETGREYQSI